MCLDHCRVVGAWPTEQEDFCYIVCMRLSGEEMCSSFKVRNKDGSFEDAMVVIFKEGAPMGMVTALRIDAGDIGYVDRLVYEEGTDRSTARTERVPGPFEIVLVR